MRSIASLPCKIVGRLIQPLFKNLFNHQGFFAVKRRAVFFLGAKWTALERGWRRDCVVGGMETRFQCRKAHSRTAKCEAFHVAPRLFFRFLSLIPSTIRQQCITFPLKYRIPTIQNRFGRSSKKKKWVRPIFSLGAHPFPRHITCLNSLGAYSSSV